MYIVDRSFVNPFCFCLSVYTRDLHNLLFFCFLFFFKTGTNTYDNEPLNTQKNMVFANI